MLKSSNSREQEKESGRNGDLYCCLLEDREKCRRWAGNASFNFRVQKLVKQKKLGLTLNPDCKHTYICDNHKNVIQRARNKRKKSPHSEDENESADMVDFSSLQISTLRRYRRHFKLQNKAGMNKSQLLELHRITMKSKKHKKDKDKKRDKTINGPLGDDQHQGAQNAQPEEASQKEELEKLKRLPEDEFNSKFEKMLDEMNLKNENLRVPLRKQPHDKKVDMLFQFLKRQNALRRSSGLVSTADYIRELSKLEHGEDLLQCLQSLRVSLTGGLLSWIKEFGEKGLDCLLNILRSYVCSSSQLELKIQHECAKCLKAYMNNGFGLNMMLKNIQGLTLLAQCIRLENPGMMQDVVKVMAAVGLVAHDKALEALTLKAEAENKPRFIAVVEALKSTQSTPPLMVACLQLINAVVSTPDDLDFRLHLRNEFMRIGLLEALPQLREFDQDDLNVQLEIFDDQKEEDALEFQHRFNDIAIHLEYPFQASSDLFICIRSNDNKGLCLS
eukprot:gene332-9991_t